MSGALNIFGTLQLSRRARHKGICVPCSTWPGLGDLLVVMSEVLAIRVIGCRITNPPTRPASRLRNSPILLHTRTVALILPDDGASLSFVASETSLCNELEIAAQFTASAETPLMVSSAKFCGVLAELRASMPSSPPLIGDTRQWRNRVATVEEPTTAQVGMGLQDLDEWAASFLYSSKADAVLTPSHFVTCANWAALDAVLVASSTISVPELVTLIATDAAMLGSRYVSRFLTALHSTPRRRFAFIFAAKKTPLQNRDRLGGLRDLLGEFPGSWIVGVDALVASDALAHGAGLVAVGTSSGHRWPRRPGDKSGPPPARNFLPGLFLRELLEFRSSDFYADWYADSPSPWCKVCERRLDMFDPIDTDKRQIIEHNMHTIHRFSADLLCVDAADRPAWLREVRLAALDAHGDLTSQETPVQADKTLRYLCEMDDPYLRTTTPSGSWI